MSASAVAFALTSAACGALLLYLRHLEREGRQPIDPRMLPSAGPPLRPPPVRDAPSISPYAPKKKRARDRFIDAVRTSGHREAARPAPTGAHVDLPRPGDDQGQRPAPGVRPASAGLPDIPWGQK